MPRVLRPLIRGLCGLCSLLLLQGCSRDARQSRWGLSVRTFDGHPAVLLDLRATLPDGRSFALEDALVPQVAGPIGAGLPVAFADEGFRPRGLPVRLDVAWYAARGRTCHAGTVILPYERLVALFAAGRIEYGSGRRRPHAEISLGLLPEGRLALYLWNRYDTMLVDSFVLPAVDAATLPLRAAQHDAMAAADAQVRPARRLPPWDELTRTHALAFAFRSEAELLVGHLDFVDGQQTFFDAGIPASAIAQQDPGRRWPVPERMEILWRNRRGLDFSTRIALDAGELRRQLATFGADDPVTLELTVDAGRFLDAEGYLADAFAGRICACALVAGDRRIPLARATGEAYWNRPDRGHH